MMALNLFWTRLRSAVSSFATKKNGNVSIIFGLASMPAVLFVGAAVDYFGATADKSNLQGAVDAAALAGVQVNGESRERTVGSVLLANVNPRILSGVQYTISETGEGLRVDARGSMRTGVMSLAGVQTVTYAAGATARGVRRDLSCILATARNLPAGEVALDFNGSPSVALTGCGMMSNASASCSGHSTNAPYTMAVGSISGCPNQQAGRDPVPDIYESLTSEIQFVCGGFRTSTTWSAGATLPLPNMIAVTKSSHVEYHVCGRLRLDGVGQLNSLSTPSDLVIVVEDGDIEVLADANVSTNRMTLVLTGNPASGTHTVAFPNGAGHAAQLSVSPSTNRQNPWHGVSIYQDPRLTTNIDMTWSPAAAFNADGVVYFGAASLTMNGNASSNNSLCTKIVTSRFTSNGNIDFRFSQDTASCRDLTVTQWESPPHLVR